MSSKHRLGAGDVEIELDGDTVVLKPNLKAAQTISRQKDGIAGAIAAIGRGDFDTLVSTITLGLGVEGREAREIPEKVFRTGMSELSLPAIRYLEVLYNGGRPPVESSEEDDEENPQNP